MDVRCEKCLTVYELDDARVGAGGLTVKCQECGNLFKVRRRDTETGTWVRGAQPELVSDPNLDAQSADARSASSSGVTALARSLVPVCDACLRLLMYDMEYLSEGSKEGFRNTPCPRVVRRRFGTCCRAGAGRCGDRSRTGADASDGAGAGPAASVSPWACRGI